jgi:acetylglutamate kinase
MLNNPQRAEALAQALPYIHLYAGKVVVIKYGGAAMTDETLKRGVMSDIALLAQIGVKVALVHGGGPEITDLTKRLGKETQFVNGLRVTDAETVDIATMALCGKVNKGLVNLIGALGGKAVGLCGIDGGMIQAKPLDPALGYVGEITAVNPAIVLDNMNAGYIPVIATIGCDADGNSYNINADTAAARLAAELGAECLISMTDAPGLLLDKNDPSTLIKALNVSEAPRLTAQGVIAGGMIPKVECCVEAIRRGVKKVFILDGRVSRAILIELLTDEGLGTMFQ